MNYIFCLTQRRIRVASRREGAKEERNTEISVWLKYIKIAVNPEKIPKISLLVRNHLEPIMQAEIFFNL